MISIFGATCRNPSLILAKICEPGASSAINCFGLETNEAWRMRFRVSEWLVPRCGVERKTMPETASMMFLNMGSR